MKYFLKLYLFLSILILNQLSYSQFSFKKIDLPKNLLHETSGLESYENDFITHNDSGNKSILYVINLQGKVKNTFSLNKISNTDWEDLSADKSFIYIADIGNNYGVRKDLKIYKLNKRTFNIDSILISYKSQINFKSNYFNEYDAEAIATFEESILLFSKNRLKEITQIYKIPKDQKDVSLIPVGEINVNGLITGADYNEDLKLMVLSGYSLGNVKQYLYIFRDFNINYDQKLMEVIKLPEYFDNTQIESIKILSNTEILLTSEAENEGIPFLLKITFEKPLI